MSGKALACSLDCPMMTPLALRLIPLMYASQVVNAVLLPLHAIALQLLASDRAIMGESKSGKLMLYLGWLGVVLAEDQNNVANLPDGFLSSYQLTESVRDCCRFSIRR